MRLGLASPAPPLSTGIARCRLAEQAWAPYRDVKPPIRAWLNAFVLRAQDEGALDFIASGWTAHK